jgi:hypothetical protein
MKKIYDVPAIEIIELSVNDIITTSGFDGKDHEFDNNNQIDVF